MPFPVEHSEDQVFASSKTIILGFGGGKHELIHWSPLFVRLRINERLSLPPGDFSLRRHALPDPPDAFSRAADYSTGMVGRAVELPTRNLHEAAFSCCTGSPRRVILIVIIRFDLPAHTDNVGFTFCTRIPSYCEPENCLDYSPVQKIGKLGAG